MRHVTYITEVSVKRSDGRFCPHVDSDFCEKCKPKELTLIGHWDVGSTIQSARQSNLGMAHGVAVKELLIQYFAIDQEGRKVPPKMLEQYSEGFEGPAEFIVDIDNNHPPLNDEIVNE